MALVLIRKPGGVICIGDDISIQVVDIQGDQVRIAITAPRDVTIIREELLEGRPHRHSVMKSFKARMRHNQEDTK